MLDLPRYLLGVAEIGALVAFATLGAGGLRARLLPDFSGAPAHLATAVIALALLLWIAELLGTFGLFEPLPYVLGVAVVGTSLRAIPPAGGAVGGTAPEEASATGRGGGSPAATGPAGVIAWAIAAAAVVVFAAGARLRLSTGMTGFDSTWYHGPLAAELFQSGSTWDLHFIAPQFLAWFYPASSELFHAIGMLAFDRDLLSPLLNLGWFVGCLVAVWCIGRPFGVAPWSLALGAIALSVPAFADQAGEARNDIVGTFFLLAAVAIAVSTLPAGAKHRTDEPTDDRRGGSPGTTGTGPVDQPPGESSDDPGSEAGDVPNLTPEAGGDPVAGRTASGGLSLGGLTVIGLSAGLAAGTKLNFLPPAAVLVVGLAVIAPVGGRGRALVASSLAALAGGGYWYLRNLAHSGNPLPWFDSLGPISLSAPDQPLGGREGHSVLGYLTDGSVWSDWLLPGLRDGLTALWPLLLGAAMAGLLLCVCVLPALRSIRRSLARNSGEGEQRPDGVEGHSLREGRVGGPVLVVAGLTGLAAAAAWLVAPTSASGPEGMPRGFESGLRYLAPALVLGLALLPTRARRPAQSLTSPLFAHMADKGEVSIPWGRGAPRAGLAGLVLLAAIAIGYPVQRHYLEKRYAAPSFTTPGLSAAFAWARDIHDARIATTATRQYPLYGTDLSNRVQFIGEERPHGGFTAPTTCRDWRRLIKTGDYDYVVASRDRLEPGKPPYPATASWTAGPGAARVLLRIPPTVIFRLTGPLDPATCR